MDFSNGMNYKQIQIQHGQLGQDNKNHFSAQGLNSHKLYLKLLKIEQGGAHAIRDGPSDVTRTIFLNL